jgi:uncharacterized membrane protein
MDGKRNIHSLWNGTDRNPFARRARSAINQIQQEKTMAVSTYLLLANQYSTKRDALADYEAVRKLYADLRILDTYDAAVLTRRSDGKAIIVHRMEGPTAQLKAKGLITGLAVGVAVALFPAISLSMGVAAGGIIGAGYGAIAGHLARGLKQSDLKDLGELLDHGTSGLLVVAATDVESRVDAAITRAKKRAKARLQADTDAIKKELDLAMFELWSNPLASSSRSSRSFYSWFSRKVSRSPFWHSRHLLQAGRPRLWKGLELGSNAINV